MRSITRLLLLALVFSINAFAGKVKVVITPGTVTLASGGTQQFTASVSSTSTQRVTWSATSGTISSSGLFTAPTVSVQTSVTVSAKNLVGPKPSGNATVTVQPPPPLLPHTVSLIWAPSVTLNVVSYNIYRKLLGGSYALEASAVVGTSWRDTTVISGQTYVYVATVTGGSGESAYSNEVTAMIP
jgi:fibronectin type 3 domain-containing protein